MALKVVIIDSGSGNLSSVRRSVERIGAACTASSRAADIAGCDKIILPGVGHFKAAMAGLEKFGLVDALEKAIFVDKKPVLGICLGMELMAKTSEEGNAEGLGWLDADAVRFRVSDNLRYKIPHIGWNRLGQMKKKSVLMNKIPDSAEFYFLHSYYLNLRDRTAILHEAEYELAFPAVIEKDNIFGVQFHPEKSHQAGLQLLRNFIEL